MNVTWKKFKSNLREVKLKGDVEACCETAEQKGKEMVNLDVLQNNLGGRVESREIWCAWNAYRAIGRLQYKVN